MTTYVIKLIPIDEDQPCVYVEDLYGTTEDINNARLATTEVSAKALVRRWEQFIESTSSFVSYANKYKLVEKVPVKVVEID